MLGRITTVTKYLLLINIGLLMLSSFAATKFGIDLSDLLGLHYIYADNFKPFQFITYMFMHANIGHLIGNMFALFIFGPLLENFWGPKRFLIFYLATGIGAGVLYSGIQYVEFSQMKTEYEYYISNPDPNEFNDYILTHARQWHPQMSEFIDGYYDNPTSVSYIRESVKVIEMVYHKMSNIPMVGASASVFGILMAFGLLFPNTTLMIYFIAPVKAKYVVAFYGLYEVYGLMVNNPGDNVAHFAHLAGMLIAYLLIRFWRQQRTNFY